MSLELVLRVTYSIGVDSKYRLSFRQARGIVNLAYSCLATTFSEVESG